MSMVVRFLISAFAVSIAFAQENTCYWRSNDNTRVITDGAWFACNNTQQVSGGAQLCCLQGSECGTDALCHQPSSSGGFGWFVGGCTDARYEDPVCRTSCTGDSQTWIQYNYTSQLWHCCGDGGCTGTPTSETFQAAPPEQFSAVPSGPQSALSSSSSAAETGAATGLSTPKPSAASGLSTGAKAGLGVLAAISGIAIAVALAFFILWRKAKRGHKTHSSDDRWLQEQGMMQQNQQHQSVYAHYGSQPANYHQRPPEEMGAGHGRTSELPGEETVHGAK